MSPVHMRLWRDGMGYTPQQAAEALDISTLEIEDMERGRRLNGKPVAIDRRTALACTALYHRLKPCGDLL